MYIIIPNRKIFSKIKIMNILLTGSNGMLGKSISQFLAKQKFRTFLHSRDVFDVKDQKKLSKYISEKKIDFIIHCASIVTGIHGQKKYGHEILYENQLIDKSVITSALNNNVKNFIYISSSSIYPPSDYPLQEKDILTGEPDPGNFFYSTSKLMTTMVLKKIDKSFEFNYKTLVCPNLFGLNDRQDPNTSHLINAIFNKCLEFKKGKVKEIEIWGDGRAKREFLFSDNVSDYIATYCIGNISKLPSILNIGAGEDYSIKEYYEMICEILQIEKNFSFLTTMPSGANRKLMDISLSKKHSWEPKITLHEGLKVLWRREFRNN